MSTPVETLLGRLEGVRQSGKNWSAKCPAHEDRTASLSIACGDDGRCLVHCHAGCDTRDVVSAVRLEMSDLMPQSGEHRNGKAKRVETLGREVCAYDYKDANGNLVYQVVRYQVVDEHGSVIPGKKTFLQRHPNGKGGWAKGRGDAELVPYRLPQLIQSNGIQFVFEGEKDVDNADAVGLSATCNVGGANSWKSVYNKWLMGCDVVVIADNDDKGRQHAKQVAASLYGTASSIRILELPDLPPKGDFSDWLESSFGDSAEPEDIRARLIELVGGCEEWEPNDESCEPSADQPEPPSRFTMQWMTSGDLARGSFDCEYLIENTLAKGQSALMGGPFKGCKTGMLVDMGISLASGSKFLGRLQARQTPTGIVCGEGGYGELQERAIRTAAARGHHLADLGDRLVWSDTLPQLSDIQHLDALESFITTTGIECLLLDPAYLCIDGAEAEKYFAIGKQLRGVAELCKRLEVTWLLATHTKKNTMAQYEPLTLADISWSGFAEFARQWLLVNRRERYAEGTGEHKLWLSVGGSAGHSALWGVDISEGTRDTVGGRFWTVETQYGSEVEKQQQDETTKRREANQQAKKSKQAEADQSTVTQAMQKLGKADTITSISDVARISGSRTRAAVFDLIANGHAREVTTTKTNGQEYTAYELCCDE